MEGFPATRGEVGETHAENIFFPKDRKRSRFSGSQELLSSFSTERDSSLSLSLWRYILVRVGDKREQIAVHKIREQRRRAQGAGGGGCARVAQYIRVQ